MKKIIVAAMLLAAFTASAKKVKFAVNMSNEVVNTTGIHIMGDFQEAAGYPFNWDPASTQLIQEASDTNVYSIVLDIPAGNVYLYRFINGIHTYETEFVPEESRWNGAFDDNRWMYLDSAANDTTFIGVLPYGANAPDGLALVVFRVNMINETIGPEGVHMGANFQGWDPSRATLVSHDDTTYRYQAYIPVGTYEYKFANGITVNDFEYVAGACAVNGNRQVIVTGDMLVDPVNYGSCLVGISEAAGASITAIYPNPSSGMVRIVVRGNDAGKLIITDMTGRIVLNPVANPAGEVAVDGLQPGAYQVHVEKTEMQRQIYPLLIQ